MVRQEDEQHEAAMVNEPDDDSSETTKIVSNSDQRYDNDDVEWVDYSSDIGKFAIDLLEYDFYYFSASVLSDRSKFVSFIDRLTAAWTTNR